MASTAQAAHAYSKQGVESASPLDLIVRVFDEASRNLAQARAALAKNDAAAKGERVHRVCRCIDVLQTALDMDQGGDVAQNLDRLYTYMQSRLTHGHLRNDDEAFGEVATHLTELGSAWREAASRPFEAPRKEAG